ncbi:MAG: hypothetical protein JF571_03770 [Asticcacaulis sp.]|nr:hypothetical protein [Asticcacaulis sp.]
MKIMRSWRFIVADVSAAARPCACVAEVHKRVNKVLNKLQIPFARERLMGVNKIISLVAKISGLTRASGALI